MRPHVIYAPNVTYLNIWKSAININPSILVAYPCIVYLIFFSVFYIFTEYEIFEFLKPY